MSSVWKVCTHCGKVCEERKLTHIPAQSVDKNSPWAWLDQFGKDVCKGCLKKGSPDEDD